MSKNFITVLTLTLITLLTWVAFQVISITLKSTIPEPTQQQIKALNPNIDKSLIEDLEKSKSN